MSHDNTRGRRTFLAAAGGAAVAGILHPNSMAVAVGKPVATVPVRPKNSADNALVPPFAVRVLNKMGFGPARRVAFSPPGGDPNVLFGSGFETPRINAALGMKGSLSR